MAGDETDALDRHIGARLRKLREGKGWSQERVGELIHVTPQQLSRLERGNNRLSASQLFRLARGLDAVPLYFFLEYEELPEELGRVRNVVQEPRLDWGPGSPTEEEALLLMYWRSLPQGGKRRALLAFLEEFSG